MTDFPTYLASLEAPDEDASHAFERELRDRGRRDAVHWAMMELPTAAVLAIESIRGSRPTGSAWAAAEIWTTGNRLIIGPTGSGKTLAATRIALRAAWRDFASIGYVCTSDCNRMSAQDFSRIAKKDLLIVDELAGAVNLYKERKEMLFGLIDAQTRTRGASLIGCSTMAVSNLDIGAERVRRFGDVVHVARDW